MDRHTPLDGYTYWPHWLKLERQDSRFTGYYSADGANWIKVGEAEAAAAADRLDAGVFAHRDSARFRDFQIR